VLPEEAGVAEHVYGAMRTMTMSQRRRRRRTGRKKRRTWRGAISPWGGEEGVPEQVCARCEAQFGEELLYRPDGRIHRTKRTKDSRRHSKAAGTGRGLRDPAGGEPPRRVLA
jgi:hypothetical protein